MKKFDLIVKGILLWFTTLILLLSILDIDNIIDKGFDIFFTTIIINAALLSGCFFTITKKEFLILSGHNWFNSVLNKDLNEN